MRRFLTVVLVASATAAASTWWLYDGDIAEAVDPVLPMELPVAPPVDAD